MRVFEEKQWFNQWWLQLLNFALLALLLYGCYNWYVLRQNMGNVAADDTEAQLVVIPLLLLAIGIIYIFKLETTIDERGISYRFFPIHKNKKMIPWNQIEKCYTRKYKPLSEYGGWGYKFGMGSGKALNVKGNEGIQLKLKNNKKLLIGTQKSKEAQLVIDKYFKNEGI